MISTTQRYWATGVVTRWSGHIDDPGSGAGRWSAHVDFCDDGFCSDDAETGQVSTEGTLRTRYFVRDGETVSGLRAALDAILSDANRLGIEFNNDRGPCLYYEGDGEDPDWPPPPGWRELLCVEADRLGWQTPDSNQQ